MTPSRQYLAHLQVLPQRRLHGIGVQVSEVAKGAVRWKFGDDKRRKQMIMMKNSSMSQALPRGSCGPRIGKNNQIITKPSGGARSVKFMKASAS